MRETVLKFRSR